MLWRREFSKLNLAVVILADNEEKNLPACLQSVQGLDCDVFVVDSGSTDRTKEIATAAGAQVFEHPFENYAAQRNWAQQNLPIKSEWLLHLDADERLTPELVSEIRERLGVGIEDQTAGSKGQGVSDCGFWISDLEDKNRRGSAEQIADGGRPQDKLKAIDGFLLRKRTFFMGRWIRHGGHYPSYHLRIFRKGKGVCEDRLYDQHFVVNGNVEKLQHDYVDVLSSDLDTWTQRHVRWAELEAKELLNGDHGNGQVRSAFFGNPIERRRWLRNGVYGRSPLFVRPFLYWIYRYFFRLGFLDGKEGFIFHFLQGFWFRLLVDIKLDEMRRRGREGAGRL